MKDNALVLVLFVYCVSGGITIVDTLLAAPMGIDLVNADGELIGPQIRHIHERMTNHELQGEMLIAAGDMDAGTLVERGVKSVELGLHMMVELVRLMLGLYMFDLLLLLGVPSIAVHVIAGAYVLLLARFLLGHMPAITAALQSLTEIYRMGARVAGPAGQAVARLIRH